MFDLKGESHNTYLNAFTPIAAWNEPGQHSWYPLAKTSGFSFAKCSLSFVFPRPRAIAPGALAGVTLIAGGALMGGIFLLTKPIPLSTPLGRNYDQAPFDMIDAVQHCQQQAHLQMGDRLAMAYLDDHSSRWDEKEGLYKIFMVAYSGEASDYNESAIHCYIDPKAHA